jgi:predicted amidohydrolase
VSPAAPRGVKFLLADCVSMQIAVVQFEAGPDVEQNIDRATDRVRAAADRGADLVVLPEVWTVGYFAFENYRSHAEPIDGPTMTRLQELAAELEIHLHTGSIVERDGEDCYNTSGLIGPDGALLDTYRKLHLFGYDSEEQRLLTPGEEVTAIETALGTVGLTTCYDLRFPELYRTLLNRGVELLLVTSAWPDARLDHWRLLTRTRALETQTILAAANLAGTNAGVDLAGRSCIVDPNGVAVADAGTGTRTATAEFDRSAVENAREEFPVLGDRRFELEFALE